VREHLRKRFMAGSERKHRAILGKILRVEPVPSDAIAPRGRGCRFHGPGAKGPRFNIDVGALNSAESRVGVGAFDPDRGKKARPGSAPI
jgi:hypothetical protein